MADGFLERLSQTAREELERSSVRRTWSRGSTIFSEGDPADRVVVIESGLAKTISTAIDGNEVTLGLRVAGDVLGELGAIDGGARSASVVVVDAVTALVVTTPAFRSFLASHAEASLALLDIVAGRVRDASRRQVEYGTRNTIARLAIALVELARHHSRTVPNGLEITLVTQDELASMCGASRESIARGLATMRAEGLLETGRQVITIVDLERLTDLAES